MSAIERRKERYTNRVSRINREQVMIIVDVDNNNKVSISYKKTSQRSSGQFPSIAAHIS